MEELPIPASFQRHRMHVTRYARVNGIDEIKYSSKYRVKIDRTLLCASVYLEQIGRKS